MTRYDYELARLALESSRYGPGPGRPGGSGFGAPGGAGGYGADSGGPSYAGRGPRGYRRPDRLIHEELCETLTRDGFIDASGLEVEVEDGEVSLSGTVPDRRTKRAAVEAAERIRGVRDVHTAIRTVHSSQQSGGR